MYETLLESKSSTLRTNETVSLLDVEEGIEGVRSTVYLPASSTVFEE